MFQVYKLKVTTATESQLPKVDLRDLEDSFKRLINSALVGVDRARLLGCAVGYKHSDVKNTVTFEAGVKVPTNGLLDKEVKRAIESVFGKTKVTFGIVGQDFHRTLSVKISPKDLYSFVNHYEGELLVV